VRRSFLLGAHDSSWHNAREMKCGPASRWCMFTILAKSLCCCTNSGDLKTSGIGLGVTVTAESAEASRVGVDVFASGDVLNVVELTSGDTLSAEANGTTVGLVRTDHGHYVADFATGAANTQFRVGLMRSPPDTSAPNSSGTLPAPFDVQSLRAQYSRGQALQIAWSPSGTPDAMRIELSSNCISGVNGSFLVPSDPGVFTIAGNTLKLSDPAHATTCDVAVTLRRQRRGTADASLNASSTFLLEQMRYTSFQSTP
jgi:hypothetical protein